MNPSRPRGALVRLPLIVTLAAAATTACTSAKKQETASLAAAVDRFLRADNAARPAAAPAIAAVKVTDPEVMEARNACVQATEATARALSLKSEVERGLDDLKRGRITHSQAAERGLDEKLALAMRLLEDGKTAMPLCEERMTALKAKVGL